MAASGLLAGLTGKAGGPSRATLVVMDVPTTFPIFPLEAVVLLPGAIVPLHIFEPRYRQMVADALEGDRVIGMAMPLQGHPTDLEHAPPVHPVVGLGQIVRHESLEDGRWNILLRGVARMRIEEELASDLPYRVVRAAILQDAAVEGDLVERVRAVAGRIEWLDVSQITTLARGDPGAAVNLALLSAKLSPRDAHRLHALPDVAARLSGLERLLDTREGRTRVEIRDGDPRLN